MAVDLKPCPFCGGKTMLMNKPDWVFCGLMFGLVFGFLVGIIIGVQIQTKERVDCKISEIISTHDERHESI